MSSNKGLTVLVFTLALVAFGTLSLASQAGEKISLMAQPKSIQMPVGLRSSMIQTSRSMQKVSNPIQFTQHGL